MPPGASFYARTLGWTGGLLALTVLYRVLTGAALDRTGAAWQIVHLLANGTGLLLPFAAFAGGVATHAVLRARGVALRAGLLVLASWALMAFLSPLAQYRSWVSAGMDGAARFPMGVETPFALAALRSSVVSHPPAEYSFSVERPFQAPPNWLTYLIHSPAAIACFALLAALLGWACARLTLHLPPPPRENALWALGVASSVAFMAAVTAAGEWVRLHPSNPAVLAAWGPLLVPLVELGLLAAVLRRWGRLGSLPTGRGL